MKKFLKALFFTLTLISIFILAFLYIDKDLFTKTKNQLTTAEKKDPITATEIQKIITLSKRTNSDGINAEVYTDAITKLEQYIIAQTKDYKKTLIQKDTFYKLNSNTLLNIIPGFDIKTQQIILTEKGKWDKYQLFSQLTALSALDKQLQAINTIISEKDCWKTYTKKRNFIESLQHVIRSWNRYIAKYYLSCNNCSEKIFEETLNPHEKRDISQLLEMEACVLGIADLAMHQILKSEKAKKLKYKFVLAKLPNISFSYFRRMKILRKLQSLDTTQRKSYLNSRRSQLGKFANIVFLAEGLESYEKHQRNMFDGNPNLIKEFSDILKDINSYLATYYPI